MSRPALDALLTVRQVADRLGVDPMTVRRLQWSGRLEHVRIGTEKLPRVRFRASSVEAFIAAGAVPATREAPTP